jgi:hypothetical protein
VIKRRFAASLAAVLFLCIVSSAVALIPAFPGAEGSGRFTLGGRGGSIYEVTNLSNSGAGSIVDALSQPNRMVVFRVAGTIELGDVILEPKSYTTIAGQTAPGDGICIKGRFHITNNAHDIVIRYIRVRVDKGAANSSGDAIDIDYGYNIIIDHVSGSYSRDETISCQEDSDKVTVQWCIMSEALTYESHSYGSLIRGQYGQEKTYHHNLYAHNQSRNPRPGNYLNGSSDPEGLHFDFRNNVVYNWLKTVPGYGDSGNYVSRYNFIGNVYVPGPESTNNGYGYRELSAYCYGYFTDNSCNGTVPADPWSVVLFDGLSAAQIDAYKARSYLVPMEPVTTTSSAQARIDVLAGVGASLSRDAVDTRMVNDVINKTGHSISSTDGTPPAGGFWPVLLHAPYPQDSDHDGMPDWWEEQEMLDSENASDGTGDSNGDGYTNVEDYLNYLAAGGTTMGWATAPHGMGSGSISMTASNAIDPNDVQYYFQCVSGGGHDSGWQSSTTYTDTGLTPLTVYSYRVKARCAANMVETQYSAAASSTTEVVVDNTPPTPEQMTWLNPPSATGIDSITMTATTAHDSSSVEYFFANITDANHDSGWQDSPVFTDTGLFNNTTYTYCVIARDKSANHNETDWSVEASAATIRYICMDTITADVNSDCQVDFADLAMMADSWAQGSVPIELVVNGGFDSILAPWSLVNISGATGTMAASFDGVTGNPAGSALIWADNTVATNNHRFYQVFAVTQAKQYALTGQWSGNIVGLVTNPTGGSLRNWAEVFVSFETSTTPVNWGSSALMYKKAYGAGTTNTSTGIWDWEPFVSSPNGSNPPANGIFTATGPYMVIAFNLGGRVGSGTPNIYADNISVIEVMTCPPFDLNGDCVLDWMDILDFASQWLVCNRDPVGECWR